MRSIFSEKSVYFEAFDLVFKHGATTDYSSYYDVKSD